MSDWSGLPDRTASAIPELRRWRPRSALAVEQLSGTWEKFCDRYADSGKALGDADWGKAAMEAASQALNDADMVERVIPAIEALNAGLA